MISFRPWWCLRISAFRGTMWHRRQIHSLALLLSLKKSWRQSTYVESPHPSRILSFHPKILGIYHITILQMTLHQIGSKLLRVTLDCQVTNPHKTTEFQTFQAIKRRNGVLSLCTGIFEIGFPPVKTNLLSVKFELGPLQIQYARCSATFSDDLSLTALKRPTTEHKVPAYLSPKRHMTGGAPNFENSRAEG